MAYGVACRRPDCCYHVRLIVCGSGREWLVVVVVRGVLPSCTPILTCTSQLLKVIKTFFMGEKRESGDNGGIEVPGKE